eukprot:3155808-Amphidinium_carterae.1
MSKFPETILSPSGLPAEHQMPQRPARLVGSFRRGVQSSGKKASPPPPPKEPKVERPEILALFPSLGQLQSLDPVGQSTYEAHQKLPYESDDDDDNP